MNEAGEKLSPEDRAIEAAAAVWLVDCEDGLDAEKVAEFARWRMADPRHAAALAKMEAATNLLQKMPLVRDRIAGSPSHRELQSIGTGEHRGKIVTFSVALKVACAIAACLAIAFVGWRLRGAGETFVGNYATTTGGYERVVLPDESVVELNAETDVSIHYSKAERRVVLSRGEAHFSVAKNAARPFVVRADGVAVRAVGTAFDVRLESQAVAVTVTEGRVQVGQGIQPVRGAAASEAAEKFPVLVAGQRIVVPRDGSRAPVPQLTSLDAVGLKESLAWKIPRLVFNETPLADVVDQFNRHNVVKLVIADGALGRRAVGGTFRADQVETFVRLLEDSRDVAVDRVSADRIVLRQLDPAAAR
jgi:transmembrane sensor